MNEPAGISRRSVLAASAAGAGALALAGCSSGGSPAADPSESPGQQVLALSELKVGEAKSVDLPDGAAAIVSRPSEAKVACFSAICTHMQCIVAPNGKQLDCPCHGSVYDAFTGKVIRGAVEGQANLAKIAVHVADGQVVTGTAG